MTACIATCSHRILTARSEFPMRILVGKGSMSGQGQQQRWQQPFTLDHFVSPHGFIECRLLGARHSFCWDDSVVCASLSSQFMTSVVVHLQDQREAGDYGTSLTRGKERERGKVWSAEAYGGVVLGGGVTGVDRSQTTDLKG